jgi:hypothetical protein
VQESAQAGKEAEDVEGRIVCAAVIAIKPTVVKRRLIGRINGLR